MHAFASVDTEDISTNTSANEAFQEIVRRAVDRRGFLKAGAGLSAALFLAGPLAACASRGRGPESALLGFQGIPAATDDAVAIAPGYTATVLAPWGTPLLTGAPTWKADGSDDAASQAMQVGDNHDGIHFFPMDGRSDEGLLVINHEYTTVENGEYIWLFGRERRKALNPERVAKAMNAHGISILHVTRNAKGKWQVKPRSLYNRRITASTQMKLAGPAAGAAALRTRADPSGRRVLGTFNNCGNGWTPWNTYLACEENFNTYFGSASQSDTRTAAQKRYGIEPGATAYGWEKFAERFDYAREPNECNRYGWIVEIDPFDPKVQPRKRTALGRFKHENAAVTLAADKRVVVYMGDDQRGEYLYKFVSEAAFHPGRYNPDLLDAGRLYVARFDDDEVEGDLMGRGEWIPLDKAANPDLAADIRFANQADVLIHTRLAADAVGATKMDRPEWVAVHPHSGEVYATLTNNDKRTEVNAPNPRKENIYGQIIRWREAGGDAAATAFEWDLFVLAGNPAVYTDRLDPKSGSANITPDNMFNSPDGLAFDQAGRLWIQTDGKYSNRGDYAGQGNNQMLCADPVSKEIRRFLVGPAECEVTGISFTPDSRTLFVNIQHPGENGNSHWPDGGTAIPRSATLVITKDDGGIVGT
ncbi:PhoX family phosphatase [Allopusillimonas soli]|uniref:PhoX family phosphatase n=1 Tax=Allopusillimonas soli TaxID=659016 RepID=A0A853F9W9_9BURK|nr:PhoX family phosphatase [Allopusillimonas soli]NYT35391.1 PhoX family phosphatase [Allopusillimonas soli]TEA75807.1 PhoX family phosphatase [Allopusillimonas soli]